MLDLKRRWILLIGGLLVPLMASCGSSLRSASKLEGAPALPEPKIWNGKVAAIPSLDVSLRELRFFSSGASDIAPLKNPVYKSRFEHAATNRVHPEIHLEYPSPGKKVFFTLTFHVRQDGKTFRIVESQGRIDPDWTSSYHSVGIGVLGPGNWRVGAYEADVYVNGDKIATGYFEIH
jgi:hypothetical protein